MGKSFWSRKKYIRSSYRPRPWPPRCRLASSAVTWVFLRSGSTNWTTALVSSVYNGWFFVKQSYFGQNFQHFCKKEFFFTNTIHIWSVTEPILFRIDQIVSPISYIHNYVLINLTIASATRNLINKQVQFCEKLEDSLKKLVKPSDEVNSYLPVEFNSFFLFLFENAN